MGNFVENLNLGNRVRPPCALHLDLIYPNGLHFLPTSVNIFQFKELEKITLKLNTKCCGCVSV